MKKGSEGFTLIELLVVIAIIGILASIVLVSLGSARNRGSDAAVQGNLNGIRSQAELLNVNGNYTSVCTDPSVIAALNGARTAAGVSTALNTTYTTGGSNGVVTCHSTTGAWAAEAPLKSNSSWFWCVDSTGRAGTTSASTVGISDAACN